MPRRARYKVRWTHTATRDLQSIVGFISRENVSAAIRIVKKIHKAASKLTTLPERGRIVPELAEVGLRIYREILCPPWRIVYRIVDANVFVMMVIDGRQNVEDVLLERLIR